MFSCNREYRDSARALIAQIWVCSNFPLVKVRLVGIGAELLLRTDVVNILLLTVDFGARQFRDVQCGWNVAVLDARGRCVSPPFQLRAATRHWVSIFRKCEISG